MHNLLGYNIKRSYQNWQKRKRNHKNHYNLLIAQYLWQGHYQILLIMLLKEFIKLKCKFEHNDKKCNTCRNKYKNYECFFEYTNKNLIEYKCLCCNKDYQQKFDENIFLIHTNFL